MLPTSSVAVTAPLIDIAYGDSSLQLVGGYSCGGSRPTATAILYIYL